MSDHDMNVMVAGVPHGCQHATSNGHWLTAAQIAAINSVSPRIKLTHLSSEELARGEMVWPAPNVLLVETSGANPDLDDLIPNQIPASLFSLLVTQDLQWVQSCSSGVEHLVPALPESVTLTNAAGNHSRALAESVMGAVLSHAKRFSERLENQHHHLWQPLFCKELKGSSICIVGTGHIGTAVARMAETFAMQTIGVRRTPQTTPYFSTVVGSDKLRSVLPIADYLVVACPLTEETRGLVGRDEFALMKPGAFFANVSRGAVVDEDALVEALLSKRIAGAFLDAFCNEPLPRWHPLWDAPGVLIIPHDSHSSQYVGDNMVSLFCENLGRYLRHEPMRNVIDRARGY